MKISDEMLQAWIEMMEAVDPKTDYGKEQIIPLLMARELQQLRDERRWRKIGVDEPEIGKCYQVNNTLNGFLFYHQRDKWGFNKHSNIMYLSTEYLIKNGSTHFRPMPDAVPEVK